MLKYLIIQLSDDAVSFCHYPQKKDSQRNIDISDLKKGIFWAMKENVTVQFLYPRRLLSYNYKDVVESIDHVKIVSNQCEDFEVARKADIIVFENIKEIDTETIQPNIAYVLRGPKEDIFNSVDILKEILAKSNRTNIVITDIEDFSEDDYNLYNTFLGHLITIIKSEYLNGHYTQLNLLTDRMLLDDMNNCGAGFESITLAPDGNFYICPAYYLSSEQPVGNVNDGVNIKNQQLYQIDHAPICRICDAWQCRRCVWLNKKTTLEVNTPSHEQCVVAHIERNASRKLLAEIRKIGQFLPDKEISSIDYLDPFDNLKNE